MRGQSKTSETLTNSRGLVPAVRLTAMRYLSGAAKRESKVAAPSYLSHASCRILMRACRKVSLGFRPSATPSFAEMLVPRPTVDGPSAVSVGAAETLDKAAPW